MVNGVGTAPEQTSVGTIIQEIRGQRQGSTIAHPARSASPEILDFLVDPASRALLVPWGATDVSEAE